MNINGLVFHDGGCWLADIPALDMMVQGDSFEDAFEEIQKVFVEELPKVDAKFYWISQEQGVFSLKLKKPGQIFHEMIKRHREGTEMSVARAAKRIKSMEPKDWSDIESGSLQTTTAQFFSMLDALDLEVFVSIKKKPDLSGP